MSLLLSIGVILISSVAIYFAGKYFADASSAIGDYFRIPRDVKGATFDAISSSMPELLVALYSVIVFKQFEVGIGTIAGSALFNLLIILGICVFLSPVVFKIGKKVISRDALFYMISVFMLVILIIYFKSWGLIISLVLLGGYLIYVLKIASHTKKYRRETKGQEKKPISLTKQILIFIATLGVIGLFTYLLTHHSIAMSEFLGVSPIIIAFTITAAATSIPDTVISAVNARKGDLDDATSNVFGSNIFNIFVGLGLPLLIYTIIKGAVEITFNNLEIILGLLGATILVIYFFGDDHKLGKREGIIMLIMYFVFLAYVVLLSMNLF
jgi:cation:H+ antiporter